MAETFADYINLSKPEQRLLAGVFGSLIPERAMAVSGKPFSESLSAMPETVLPGDRLMQTC